MENPMRKRGTAISATSIPRSRVGLPFTTTSKNNDEGIVMDHQPMETPMRKRGTAISATSIPRSRVGLPFTTASKNNDEGIVMDHQVRSNQPNRRELLKQSVLGAGALASLPSLNLPLLAASSDSRIEALELLLLKQNGEQRRRVESYLEHRCRWICGFSGPRLRTSPWRCR